MGPALREDRLERKPQSHALLILIDTPADGVALQTMMPVELLRFASMCEPRPAKGHDFPAASSTVAT